MARPTFRTSFFAVVSLVHSLIGSDALGGTISFTGLGYLPGGSRESWARGASFDGSVVFGWSLNADERYEPFLWTQAGGMSGLGTNGNAYAVSADGTVVVGVSGAKAFRWTVSSGMTQLGSLPSLPDAQYLANAVSADGRFAAGYMPTRTGGALEAAAWLPNLVRLGDLPLGDFYSDARGISGDGSVVVGIGTGGLGIEAFRSTNGVMTGLGYLPGAVGNSGATAITPDGNIIVGYSSSSPGIQAFRWTETERMVGLGDLPGGSFYSEATAVSADGSIIVGNSKTALGDEAFVWDSTHGMRNLRDLLVAGGADLTGWGTLHAWGVSGDGQTIVGIGHRSSGREAWTARLSETSPVPEPSTFVGLASLGAIGLMAAWRRCRRVGRLVAEGEQRMTPRG